MALLDLTQFESAQIGTNVSVECDEFLSDGDFHLGDNVKVVAARVRLGAHARIEHNTVVRALRGTTSGFSMGDETLIGHYNQVLTPEFSMGDYTRIFHSCLLSGYEPLTIGHNCWIGQTAILNSADRLDIGNNVCMGGAHIWTHVSSGEILEGCTILGKKPVVIEDNVWLMGFGQTVVPGVVLGRNSIILSGSVVTRSTEPFHTYTGNPAKDITDKVNGWKPVTPAGKLEMMRGFVDEFAAEYPEFEGRAACLDLDRPEDHPRLEDIISRAEPHLVFLKAVGDWGGLRGVVHSVFDLESKHYTKRKSAIEVTWMKFANGYRARFLPLPGPTDV